MKMKRIMLAAPKSGSGKTTITCALLQALMDRGESVISYKCGPDYIDPMFHRTVIGVPSRNLDTFFTGEEQTRKLFLKDRGENDFAVIEGAMGLYDGLGGIRKEGSSYHLAEVTKTPIILVVDVKGMGRSMIPLIAGFLSYDKAHLIKGVILNRMSAMYYATMKPLIEEELPIKVVGYVPDMKDFALQSRHLGLVMPEEITGIREDLKRLTEEITKTVCVDEIVTIAEHAPVLNDVTDIQKAEPLKASGAGQPMNRKQKAKPHIQKAPVIAVAKDEAFCFYYEENLRLLQECGAKLVDFSPIHDTRLPDGCCGILLGGGYPELHAEALAANEEMKQSILEAINEGMPVVAECGGFLYLHENIKLQNGEEYPFVGAIHARCEYKNKLVRFGYIELEEKQSNFLPEGQKIRAHEFHYFDSSDNGSDCIATKPVTGRNYQCVIDHDHVWLSFAHLYYPSTPAFAQNFVSKASAFEKRS